MAVWNFLKAKALAFFAILTTESLVGKPIGVIGAVTPVTNPVMTPNHNAMIALKAEMQS